ncbi:MAG: asparagine synthase-related protein, partial [Pirellulaceae bacterium]|nr:asparagine synthase-related protein [Pirellulaceae bacterium]
MSDLATKREQLLESIARLGKCAIAFSAGVDSTVVAKAAQLALGDRAVAVTAVSPSLASGELDQAKSLAAEIGIRHVLISTDEFDNPDYLRNAPDRCYHCKTELYGQLDGLIGKLDVVAVLNGANG